MVMVWIITTSEKFAINITKPQLQADHLKQTGNGLLVSPCYCVSLSTDLDAFRSPALTAKSICCFSTPKALSCTHPSVAIWFNV